MQTAQQIEITWLKLSQLRPDPFNPRRISDAELENLVRSIQKFGLVDSLIVRAEDYTVIGGHQRMLAARKLGYEEVPCVLVPLSVEEARLLNLALNRISGEFDSDLLSRLLEDLKTGGADLTLSGFEEDEVSKLLAKLNHREKRERPESFDLDAALEAARVAPRAQRGDVFALGDHRVMCGDSMEAGDVAKLLGGKHASMCFTDPPYNVGLGDHGGQQRGQRRRRIQNDALPPEQWQSFVRGWARNLVANVDGAHYICMSTKEWPLVSRVLEEEGAHWSDTLIWCKDRFVLGRADYQRQYEPIWYGWREGTQHFWKGDRDQGDVWRIDRPFESELHPTMKPLALVERAIENSSQAGDSVLDLFLGSGSTLIACERTGRVCYGMELEPKYVDVALMRWEAFTGLKAAKLE